MNVSNDSSALNVFDLSARKSIEKWTINIKWRFMEN